PCNPPLAEDALPVSLARPRIARLPRQWWDLRVRRLSFEQRIYTAALVVGVVLNLWAAFAALQAQGRFPQIAFRLPNLDDISLPGRPVLRPILDPGDLRTEVSQAATAGHLTVR